MDNYIILRVDCSLVNDSPEYATQLSKYAAKHYIKNSDLGVSTFEVIMRIAEFGIALIALPFIGEYINSKRISVKFRGFELTGDIKTVLKDLCRYPEVFDQIRHAYYENDLKTCGNSRYAAKLYAEIESIIKAEENISNSEVSQENG